MNQIAEFEYQMILFDYQTSKFDFLDLFQEVDVSPGTVVCVSVGNAQRVHIRNPAAIQTLFEVEYNFALIRDVKRDAVWPLTQKNNIPKIDTKLFIINNVDDAKMIFALAKTCRDNIDFYQHLLSDQLDSFDNTVISIANHLFKSPYGFFDIPRNLIMPQSPIFDSAKDLAFNQDTGAIVSFAGVNAID